MRIPNPPHCGDASAGVEVSAVSRPDSSGMSKFSVLFDATWTPAGSTEGQSAQLVARMCPLDDAFPVFPVRRRIHFGEQDAPARPDEYVLHHTMLARLIAD